MSSLYRLEFHQFPDLIHAEALVVEIIYDFPLPCGELLKSTIEPHLLFIADPVVDHFLFRRQLDMKIPAQFLLYKVLFVPVSLFNSADHPSFKRFEQIELNGVGIGQPGPCPVEINKQILDTVFDQIDIGSELMAVTIQFIEVQIVDGNQGTPIARFECPPQIAIGTWSILMRRLQTMIVACDAFYGCFLLQQGC